jgi:thiamine-phosphate pyrophosphorylase
VTLPVLHAVTTDDVVASPEFFDRARLVMARGRGRVAVHLRTHQLPTRSAYIAAEFLAELQRVTGAWLVVNDRVDVAMAAEARGVQLTSRSLSVAEARGLAPAEGQMAIGASVHGVADAIAAAAHGADWVVAGHVFETPTHPGVPPRGASFLQEMARELAIPIVAIGGIAPSHVGGLLTAGATGVAAIRGIWGAHDAEAAVAEYLSAYDEHFGGTR